IFVRIPNVHERKGLLDGLLAGMKTRDIDTLALAQHTPGFVPRGMVKLVAMAVAVALARGSGDSNCLEMADFTRSIGEWKSLEHPITFDDIGAMKRVKEELTMSILLPSKFPEKFNSFGICKPSGVLLFGPPGCGKTFVAKAISNMSHCNFLSIKGPELITKYVGDSEKHLRDLFQKAKNLSPCVLFFDEIDSLCGKRGKNEFGNRIVNQILTLLDGMEDRGEVYIIGATNRIRSLDPALMRPGRFDKVVEVPLPGPQEALEIFEKCISKVPHEPFDFSTLDMSNLSGADIAGIVKEAAMLCLKENFDAPELKVQEKYILQSLEKHWHMRGRNKKRGGSAGPEGY
ncbi:ribosome biogenesis ATPase, partial [Pancytospora philotis]